MQNVEKIYMESPQGDEIRHVDGTTATLTPLMAAGWHQVPAPAAPTAKPQDTPKAAVPDHTEAK
jgi:hypothetical protein